MELHDIDSLLRTYNSSEIRHKNNMRTDFSYLSYSYFRRTIFECMNLVGAL